MADEVQLQLPDGARAISVDQQIEELQKITDYEIKEWPIGVLVEKFTSGRETDESEIFIPDYQREMVWTPKQQSRFIESILIKLPVPFIFAADVGEGDREGALEIIDGSQRIRTLDNFLSNRLELVGLKKLTQAIGMRFSDFSKPRQMRFKRTAVRVIELTEKADCSGLMYPDTDLGENTRHGEVFDEQAETYVFPGVQTAGSMPGAGSRI